MATAKQKNAARKNIRKAQTAAKKKRTIAHLPRKTRTALGKQASMVARRKTSGTPSDLQQRTRRELVAAARTANIEGRSKMGKSELVRALRRKRR